LKSQK